MTYPSAKPMAPRTRRRPRPRSWIARETRRAACPVGGRGSDESARPFAGHQGTGRPGSRAPSDSARRAQSRDCPPRAGEAVIAEKVDGVSQHSTVRGKIMAERDRLTSPFACASSLAGSPSTSASSEAATLVATPACSSTANRSSREPDQPMTDANNEDPIPRSETTNEAIPSRASPWIRASSVTCQAEKVGQPSAGGSKGTAADQSGLTRLTAARSLLLTTLPRDVARTSENPSSRLRSILPTTSKQSAPRRRRIGSTLRSS